MGGQRIRHGKQSRNLGSSGEPGGRTYNSVLLAEKSGKQNAAAHPPKITNEFSQSLFTLLHDIQNP